MNIKGFFKKVGSVIVKVFKGTLQFAWRSGLDDFMSRYLPVAIDELMKLAQTNSNAEFREWEQAAFNRLRAIVEADGRRYADNWIVLLKGFAFEALKANGYWPPKA